MKSIPNGRQSGKVKWFNADKGYGFIRMETGREVFVHHTAIEGEGYRSLSENDEVTFLIEMGKEGRPQAASVRLA